jgi:hypothetical protein
MYSIKASFMLLQPTCIVFVRRLIRPCGGKQEDFNVPLEFMLTIDILVRPLVDSLT